MSDEDSDEEMTKLVTRKNCKYLVNALIHGGHCKDLGLAVKMLQHINDEFGQGGRVEICDSCAKKIGTKRCSTCKTSYCSRECQLTAWPSHKTVCSAKKAQSAALSVQDE